MYISRMLFTTKSLLGGMALLGAVVVLYRNAGEAVKNSGDYANPLEWFNISVNAFWLDLLLVAGFLFLVSQLSFHENCQYELIRMGKRKWLKQQFLSIFVTAVLYLLWFIICIAIALGNVRWSSRWSEFMEYTDQMSLDTVGIDISGGFVHASNLMRIGSPVQSCLVQLLLLAACLSFLGILSFVINLCLSKNAGSIAVMAILLVYGLITLLQLTPPAIIRIMDFIHPLLVAQITLKFSDMPWQQSFLYGLVYFGAGTLLLWIIGISLVKKIDFTK